MSTNEQGQSRDGAQTEGVRHRSPATQQELNFNFALGLRMKERADRKARRAAEERREAWRASWLPVLGLALIVLSLVITIVSAAAIAPRNPVVVFMVLAVVAAGLAVIAAYITLGAHEGSPSLDLLGKQVGFASALFACAAAIALFSVDLNSLPASGESTATPTSTCTPIGRFDTRC